MPLNESSRKTRDRWPLEFDLEGIPRDNAERKRLLDQKKLLEASPEELMTNRPSPNSFAVDYQGGDTVIDINNPPNPRYGSPQNPRQEFPKMVYHDGGNVLIVNSAAEERAATKKGYHSTPSPSHDYSKVKHGRAAVADTTPNPSVPVEEVPSLSEDEMETAEKELGEYQNAPRKK